MFTERTSVGLDVHAHSVAAAAIDGVTGELFQTKLPPGTDRILERVRGLPGSVAVAYEAGLTGFGLYRALTSAGVRCVVVAPSKLQRPSVEPHSLGRVLLSQPSHAHRDGTADEMSRHRSVANAEPLTELREPHALLVQRHQLIDLGGAQRGLSLPN